MFIKPKIVSDNQKDNIVQDKRTNGIIIKKMMQKTNQSQQREEITSTESEKRVSSLNQYCR